MKKETIKKQKAPKAVLPPLSRGQYYADLMMDMVACILISTGVCLALFVLYEFSFSFVSVLILTAACTSIVTLISRKSWSIVLAAVAILAFLIYAAFFTQRYTLFSFLDWWMDKFPHGSRWFNPFGGFCVHLLIASAVCLVVFLLLRKFCRVWLMLLLTASLFIVLYVFQFSGLLFPLCITLIGIAMLLPRSLYRILCKKGTFLSLPPRWKFQLFTVPVALLAVVFSLSCVPQDAQVWKSQFFYEKTLQVQDWFSSLLQLDFGNRGQFSLTSTGFQRSEDRLGGPVRQDDTVVMLVKTSITEPLLLKGAVMDEYTGYSWRDSTDNGQYPLHNASVETIAGTFGRLNEIFSFNFYESPSTDFQSFPLEMRTGFYTTVSTDSIEVYPQTDGQKNIFYPGELSDCSFLDENGNAPNIYFDAQGEVFTTRPIPQSSPYTATIYYLNRSYPNFTQIINEYQAQLDPNSDPFYEQIAQQYLQLPDSMPENVWTLAQEIAGEGSDYEKASKLEEWLQTNCTYTLDGQELPEGRDFVDFFLEVREGSCTYFASAMTVMARMVGLPARYVIGYTARPDQTTIASDLSMVRRVTNRNAHAWVEVYLHGIGWVTFDPTAAGSSPAIDDGSSSVASSSSSRSPSSPSSSSSSPDAEIPEDHPFATVALWIFAAAFALFLLLFWRVIRQKRLHDFTHMKQKFRQPQKLLLYYQKDIFHLLAMMKLSIQPGETLKQFSQRVDASIPEWNHSLSVLTEPLMLWYYAHQLPSQPELQKISEYYDALEDLIRHRSNPILYFFRRIIFH